MIIPFASVDPARPDAVERVRGSRAAGAKGFKFHPNLQAFFPNEREVYPLYEAIAEAGVPALFHSGHSGIGTGVPGGGGLRLKYSNPMCLDDVAADFPTLQIVLAHPSFPWQDEAISICLHKENVWIDLSGWSPKYFPPQLVQYANTQLRSKVLFGSDFPLITPDRWLADFEAAPFKDEVRPLVLKENAARLLRLTPAAHLIRSADEYRRIRRDRRLRRRARRRQGDQRPGRAPRVPRPVPVRDWDDYSASAVVHADDGRGGAGGRRVANEHGVPLWTHGAGRTTATAGRRRASTAR